MNQRILILLGASILILGLGLILPLAAMAAGGITQTTYMDFTQSCTVLTSTIPAPVLADTHVSDLVSGTIVLAATFSDDFDGSTLDPRWEAGTWPPGGSYTPTIASSMLTIKANDHGWVRSTGSYTYGIIEATAEFGSAIDQHIGFANGNLTTYFIFSTRPPDGNFDGDLYARVESGSGETNTSLGPIPTGLHRYRLEWSPLDASNDRVSFYLDGVFQVEFTVNKALTNATLWLTNNGTADLQVDKVQVEPPYVTNGTYTACAFDAGEGNGWQTINWDAVLTSTTTLTAEARVSTDGSTWSDWASVSAGGLLNSSTLARYAQYRLFLATDDAQLTPEVQAVTLISDTLPSFSINDVTVTEGNAGTTEAVFTVTLSATSTHTSTINYATANSTAVASADYLAATGTLTFPPNVTTQTITITVQSDLTDEDNEKFLVNLSDPGNATLGDSQGEGTIADDDASPTVSINNASVTEGNSGTVNAVFTIAISKASGRVINVDYATADSSATAPSDYLAATGTLTFTTGITTQQVTVTVNGDKVFEPDETFEVNLTNLVNLNSSGNDIQGTGTITNDDTAGVTVTQSGGSTNVVEGGATDTYQLKLTSQPTATVTITPNPDSQVTVNPASVDFTPANWDTAQTITVTAVNDAVAEGTHTGVISHTAASADSHYNGISTSSITANITDNDTAGVSVAPTTVAVTEGGITATYAISLTSQPTATVTISMTTNGQVSANPAAISFNSSNWGTAQTITVTAVNDAVAEGTHTGVISHTATSAASQYNAISINKVTANITDNDTAGVSVAPTTVALTEGGITATYTIRLTSQPTATVTISMTTNGQVSANPAAISFNSSNWGTAQTITVTAVNDAVAESSPHAGVVTHTVASADPLYSSTSVSGITVNITDNDVSAGQNVFLPIVIK